MLKTSDVIHGLRGLIEVYGSQAPVLTDQLAALWADALNRAGIRDVAAFREALMAHVTNAEAGRFWPKPADLIGTTRAHNVVAIEAAVGAALLRINGKEFWVYKPRDGSYYDQRKIREALGVAALECFAEAGGGEAFGGEGDDRKWAAQKFTEAYRRRLMAEERAGSLDVAALPASTSEPKRPRALLAALAEAVPQMKRTKAVEPIAADRARAIVGRLLAAVESIDQPVTVDDGDDQRGRRKGGAA